MRTIHWAAAAAVVSVCAAVQAGDLFGWKYEGWNRKHPRTPLASMAAAVDELEREIDCYGSVVVKQPDVWGEARWTKHRQDFEKTLAAELGNFKFTVNAKIREADTAFLLNAAALGASTSPGTAPPTVDVKQVFSSSFAQPEFIELNDVPVVNTRNESVAGVAIEPTEFLDQMARYVDHLSQIRRINEGDDTADAAGYALNLVRIPVSILPGEKTRQGYGAEVTLTLTPELSDTLLPDTFKDLVINDLVDQLGLPVLKLMERKAWENVLTDEEKDPLRGDKSVLEKVVELLETNQPGLAAEELKGLLEKSTLAALPIRARERVFRLRNELFCRLEAATGEKTPLDVVEFIRNKLLDKPAQEFLASIHSSPELQTVTLDQAKEILNSQLNQQVNIRLNQAVSPQAQVQVTETIKNVLGPMQSQKTIERAQGLAVMAIEKTTDPVKVSIADITAVITSTTSGINQALASSSVSSSSVGAPRDRRARYPVPPTEIACVFGMENLLAVARDLEGVRTAGGSGRMHLPDAHGFLTEELDAAYRLLATMEEQGQGAWIYCPPIAKAIKLLQYGNASACSQALDALRKQFENFICETTQGQAACKTARCNLSDDCQGKTIKALAWAILVESALLNDHLIQDMKRVEQAKHVQFAQVDCLSFIGSNPDPVAKSVFNEYVRARWPVHVFAIDPKNQEQNVADSYARRREMQLALALAFTGGQINANNFSRYARRLDFELDTISLNRTVIGFSHGDDTFGWRIYPRVQVPPTEGNVRTAMRLIHGGPNRDDDLKRRQLEPGSRELLAIVIMPSFVPHIRMDVRSNWFHLTSPDRKEFTTEDSVRLGEMVGYLRQCKTQCLTEAPMGRPGDVRRLLTAVDQLEKRLPLQDALVQIPYENSQGGFQLFSEGSRNLGPELIGFYGEPGVNAKAPTQLFLVGRHFSVNSTKVIIGGQLCEADLLSREVMKVVVPKDVNTQTVKDHLGVDSTMCDAHVATPYGVSGHLLIPAINGAAASGPSFDPAQIDGCLVYSGCTASTITLPPQVKVKGYKAATLPKIKIGVSVVLGDGTEVNLSVLDDPKSPNKPVNEIEVDLGTSGVQADCIPLDKINRFLAGGTPIFSHQKPLALKVSGKATLNGVETKFAEPLVIRLVGASAACGNYAACAIGLPCGDTSTVVATSSRSGGDAGVARTQGSTTEPQSARSLFDEPRQSLDRFESPTMISPAGRASLDEPAELGWDQPVLPAPPRR